MSDADTQSRPGSICLAITSDTEHLAGVRAAVLSLSAACGFADKDAGCIALAVDEALANVIRHGYGGCGGQPIEVTLEQMQDADRTGLRITICDCGRQVDACHIVGRPLEEVRPGGLGTHIIRSVMDEVVYAKRAGGGMQLVMIKHRPDDTSQRADHG